MKNCSAILRIASLLVPAAQRLEWLAEWSAELWHVHHMARGQETAFCLGAFQDAFWFRRNTPTGPLLQSPGRCLVALGVLSALSALLAFRLPGTRDFLLPGAYGNAPKL